MNRHHAPSALAGAALTASMLISITAQATAPGPVTDDGHPPGTRPCFIWPAHWNEALDGPVPRCPSTR